MLRTRDLSGVLFIFVAMLVGVGCQAQPAGTPTGKQRRDSLKTATNWMTGTFQSKQQSRQAPSEYHDIRLVQVPIWEARDDGPWLYVEQAWMSELDRPYRQRIYQLEILDDGGIASHVFSLPGNPLVYSSPWKGDGGMGGLHPDTLVARPGCTVEFQMVDGNTFTGGIKGEGCPSDLVGASYLTSDVTLRSDRILIWDRGYDSEGRQVWGATTGPYIYKRTSSRPPR
ncbi:MAG: chromophore lyase CpcT/CpeT [Phycisphaerales bacterium]|nr:chromophore lyase CpcT/CpeT [Phycisphaerales bacterium]